MIQENDRCRKGRFLVVFDFQLYRHLRFCYPSQVNKGLERYPETHLAVHQHRLIEFEFFDTIVDQHLDVMDLGNLVPQIGDDR